LLIPDIPPEEYHHAIKMPTHSLNNLSPASLPPTTNESTMVDVLQHRKVALV
jgi:hypothetical protein